MRYLVPDSAVASGANELWVTVRAKTTDKRTREVTTKRWGFKASRAGVTIGSDPGASICIDDASLSGEHAQICLTDSGDVGVVTLGRTYLLIGQGDRSAGPVPLAKDTVMKLGACSLQVRRLARRATRLPRPIAHISPAQVSETCALRGVVSGGAGGPPPTQPRRRPSRADVACYICFEETEEDPVGNPLVTQPCACAKRVHRGCLARWISARGSRLCSICKARLPIDFTVEPPYIVVQVGACGDARGARGDARGARRGLGAAAEESWLDETDTCLFFLLPSHFSPPPFSGRAPHARPLVGRRARVHRVLRAPPHGLHHRGQRRRVRPRAARPVALTHALAHLIQVRGWGEGRCDLVLPDPSLSRTHSRISFRPHSQPQPPQPGSGRSLTTQLAAAPLPGGTFYLEDLQVRGWGRVHGLLS